MTSTDIYEAAKTIDEALNGLSETEIKKALLMALIATGKDGILIDPDSIALRTSVYVPETPCCESGPKPYDKEKTGILEE